MSKNKTQVKHMEQISLQMMDITTLKAVIAELNTKIIPSRFEKIQQSDSHTLQIAFRTLSGLTWIELCWHADCPRLVEIEPPPKSNGESTLSKQIKFGARGMALIELKQDGFNRVVEFGFAFRPNDKCLKFLVLEIMGRHSNLMLLNKSREVITLGKQIRESKSRIRPIKTGDVYSLPPPLKGIKPKNNQSFEDWRNQLSLLPVTLKEALNTCFQGVSPALLLQLASKDLTSAQRLINLPVNELSNQNWVDIYQSWKKWLKDIEEENFYLCFKGPSAYRVWGTTSTNLESKAKISLNLGTYYKKQLEKKKLEKEYQLIYKRLISRRLSEEKYLKDQKNLYSKLSDADYLQNKADGILCINKPSKNQIEEAQKLYCKAKKLRRSKEILLERIQHHQNNITFLNETDLFINYILEDSKENSYKKIDEIISIKEELEGFLLIKKNKVKKKDKNKKSPAKILEIKSPSGLAIEIGRNHRQNELISIKQARKGDIWFHAQECVGSHIVLKGSHGTIEETDLQLAADLAAFFSRAKNNSKVSIIMAQTNNLKRLKGTTIGTISPRNPKIIWGNPSVGQNYIEQSTKNA